MLRMENFRRYLVVKRKRLLAVTLLPVLLLAVLSCLPPCRNFLNDYREDAFMLKLVGSSGAEFKTINITGWVKADPERTGDAGSPEALAESAAGQLKMILSGRKKENWQNQFAGGTKIEGKLANGHAVSVLGQTMELPQGEKVSHVMISLSGTEGKRVRHYRKTIADTLGAYGPAGHVAVTYYGEIKQELDRDQLLENAERLMILAGAPVQEKTVRDNLVSLTGYSPRFVSGISYAGREVNLNVALRCNPAERVTHVYVASPVILTEY
ncbi:MAG TPA: YwmB family TATA-box binding protein [Bacillota bacterium]|nr:YwmB family TATA-box binding protein [Bacillota bacterium]